MPINHCRPSKPVCAYVKLESHLGVRCSKRPVTLLDFCPVLVYCGSADGELFVLVYSRRLAQGYDGRRLGSVVQLPSWQTVGSS